MKIIHVNSEKDLKLFNENVKKGKMLVVFVANWCGHCQYLKPIWKKMERALKKTKCVNKGIIAMVYSDYRDKIKVSANCDGYPTIKMYKDGKMLKEWNGDWTQPGILESTAKKFFSNKTKKVKSKKNRTRKRKTKRKHRKRRNKTQKRRR
tara:strand:+ start:135 stop:584 length:450 start_codon:yes stop_codon:yes gene_type:complete